MKNIFINGWNKESFLKQLEEFNGFEVCGEVGGACYYRKEGKSCFAGVFIKDEKYKSEFEDTTLGGLLNKYPEVNLLEDMPLDRWDMLNLQNIHDTHNLDSSLSLEQKVFEFIDKLEVENETT